jgi:hypothetical protein
MTYVRPSKLKRVARTPVAARVFAGKVSKADLLEALYDACALLNDVSCDDEAATVAKLRELVCETIRARGGRAPS